MDNKSLKQLVIASYTDGVLDKARVEKIAGLLNRKTLKQYIKSLKQAETQNSVFVDLAQDPIELDESMFEKMFPKKKIIYKKNPSLILGARIVDNDTVFEFNLKNNFDKLLKKIAQNYD